MPESHAAPFSAAMSLAGTWEVQLEAVGQARNSGRHAIELPGSLDERQISPRCSAQPLDHLGRDHAYVGVAIYRRHIEIPQAWAGRRVELSCERVLWASTVWLDDRLIGGNDSLSTPHRLDLGVLTPGSHVLTVRVDNRAIYELGTWSHAYSDYMQTLWNGLVGDLTLMPTATSHLDTVTITSDLAGRAFLVKTRIAAAVAGQGEVRWEIRDRVSQIVRGGGAQTVTWTEAGGTAAWRIELGAAARLWDEFDPHLYQLNLRLCSAEDVEGAWGCRQITVGLRELTTRGGQFLINGRPTIMRGTHCGGIFPLTGYPSCLVADWRRIMDALRAAGLNHIRFHSWTPPSAAFIAADEAGIYIQSELPLFSNSAGALREALPGTREAFLGAELDRILDAYGNHASFVLMAMGNELYGDYAVIRRWVRHAQTTDPRRLYACSANAEAQINMLTAAEIADPAVMETLSRPQPGDQFLVGHSYHRGGRSYVRRNPGDGETWSDHRWSLEDIAVPVVSHEVGQNWSYPNLDQQRAYVGVCKPTALAWYQKNLARYGVLARNAAFAKASTELSQRLYQDDIERQLRTPGYGGFQLLDLQDYPGQGNALIGLLDGFWQEKEGYRSENLRRCCGPTVPLARMERRIWIEGEYLTVAADLAHYGPTAIEATGVLELLTDTGQVLQSFRFSPRPVQPGEVARLGEAQLPLPSGPAALTLVLRLDGRSERNSWTVWVHQAGPVPAPPAGVLVTRQWAEALSALRSGGRVLWLADGQAGAVPCQFKLPFWTPSWDSLLNRSIGALIDPTHPALARFPSGTSVDFQWYHLLTNGWAMRIDQLPEATVAPVEMIDSPLFGWRLAAVAEFRVGAGRLLVSTLGTADPSKPGVAQMLRSLTEYVGSERFQPMVTVDEDLPRRLFPLPWGRMARAGGTVVRATGDPAEQATDVQTIALGGAAARVQRGADRLLTDNFDWDWRVSSSDGFPYEVVVGFPQPITLHGLQLAQRTFDGREVGSIGARRVSVAVSDDGRVWREVLPAHDLPLDEAFPALPFPQPVNLRLVRLMIHATVDGGTNLALNRIDLLPPPLVATNAKKEA